MAVTVGSTTFSNLTAQPFGYEESDTKRGLTARKWSVNGLLTGAEWLSLLSTYNTWRDQRIQDEDSLVSEDVGTTVAFSGTGAGGQSWSSVACWFAAAPEASQSGAYLAVSFELVDAAQALQVLLREQELSEEEEDLPNFGSVTIGSAVLKLVRPMQSYGQGPQMELTPAGSHYISGPFIVDRIRDIEGTTDLAGWEEVRSWYESQIVSVPSVGDWFPISIPSTTARNKVVNGVKTTEYTVSIQLGLVR
jgi:hypothetical protein